MALKIFCRGIIINNPELLKTRGPLLLACNHPNSFLDAIILDTLFTQPVYSLTRGDVFANRYARKILTALKMLPVYRVREGVENLSLNYKTFESCKNIFRDDGIVQIFSEGQCINEWHLRTLRKGTARLALTSWDENIDLKVLPVGLNYSSFKKSGKNIFIHFGSFITRGDIDLKEADGKRHQAFNTLLQSQLGQLVYEIDKNDTKKQSQFLEIKPGRAKKIALSIFAAAGWILHAPLYIPVRLFVEKKAGHTDHYDSIMLCALLVGYPLYILLLTLIIFRLTGTWYALLLILLFPLTAWACIQLKRQVT